MQVFFCDWEEVIELVSPLIKKAMEGAQILRRVSLRRCLLALTQKTVPPRKDPMESPPQNRHRHIN